MKKIFLYLMLALPMAMLTSCGDDDVPEEVPEEVVDPEVSVVKKDGDKLTDDFLTYEVLLSNDKSKREVTVTGCQVQLTTMIIPDQVSYEGELYSVTQIANKAFFELTSLETVKIPNSVTSIGGAAFYSCSKLKSLTLSNSLTSIGSSAFRSCSALTSITIPNSVTSIGSAAFIGSGLISVTIGKGMEIISTDAFACKNLSSVTCLANEPPSICYGTTNNADTFYDTPSTKTLHVLKGCGEKYKDSDWGKEFTDIKEDAKE